MKAKKIKPRFYVYSRRGGGEPQLRDRLSENKHGVGTIAVGASMGGQYATYHSKNQAIWIMRKIAVMLNKKFPAN